MKIQIRFNTNYFRNSKSKKWRVIVDGLEHFTDKVFCNVKSKTTIDEIIVDEEKIIKYHISFDVDDKKIQIEKDKANYFNIYDLDLEKEPIVSVKSDGKEWIKMESKIWWSEKNQCWIVLDEEMIEHQTPKIEFNTPFWTDEKDGKFFICTNSRKKNISKEKIIL